MEGHWMRVCVDVGQDGNAQGYSVERYEEWERTAVLVGALPDEPMTAEAAFVLGNTTAVERWGVQHPLPFG